MLGTDKNSGILSDAGNQSLSGIVMLVRLVQSLKARSPDAYDAVRDGDAREAGIKRPFPQY